MDNEVIKQNSNNNSNDNNTAMVSMILGIISVVLCWVPLIGLALGIVSLTLAVKGFKVSKQANKGRGFSMLYLYWKNPKDRYLRVSAYKTEEFYVYKIERHSVRSTYL